MLRQPSLTREKILFAEVWYLEFIVDKKLISNSKLDKPNIKPDKHSEPSKGFAANHGVSALNWNLPNRGKTNDFELLIYYYQ